MKLCLILCVLTIVTFSDGSLIEGFIHGAHDVAGAVLGGISGGIHAGISGFTGHQRYPQHNGHRRPGKPETVVVVVEDRPERPGYGEGQYNQNGQGNFNRPYHNSNQNPYQYANGNGYGNQNPNNFNNGNWNNHNQQNGQGQYGNPNLKPNHQFPQNPHNQNPGNQNNHNINNQFGNSHNHNTQYGTNQPVNPNNQYGYGNSRPVNPNNQYSNANNQHGNPNNQNGNTNNRPVRPNNQYGNANNQHVNTNEQNGNTNNRPIHPNSQNENQNPINNGGINRPPYSTENPNLVRPNSQEQTTKKYVIPIYTDVKVPAEKENNGVENSTKNPTGVSDSYRPLKPGEYTYGGDKIEVNTPKPDKDEDFPIDIRIIDD